MINILSYLEQTAERLPGKTAVRDPETSCTFRELEEQARRIGSALAVRCPPRSPIILLMEKSVGALQALLGVVYAGCFFVSVSPEQPDGRIAQILKVADAPAVLTDRPERLQNLPFSGTVITFAEAVEAETDKLLLEKIREEALDTDPLYCNFTSGSTGTPKGVLVCHRSVIDFIDCFPELFGITEADVIGNQAPFDFDVSVKDIWSALKTGATLVLIPKRMFSVVTELLDYLCDSGVTTLIWAVSALCLVAQFRGLTYRVPTTVNKILFSGEQMPVKYLHLWQRYLPDAHYVNLYGPTEITCNCTYYRITRPFSEEEQIPIGKPFPNERVFLLDEQDHPVTEPGKLGEICVSGTALALGYYNAPEQTNRVFVPNPLNAAFPERIYRTGDLARFNGAGELCFVGRKDFQVKYMGHRVELGEIEAALNRRPEIRSACCGYDRNRNRLVAFYDGEIEPLELKKRLYGILPTYMIPGVFRHLDRIPLTANGKIDRKQLMLTETGGGAK